MHPSVLLVPYIKYPSSFYHLLVVSRLVVSEMRVGRPISLKQAWKPMSGDGVWQFNHASHPNCVDIFTINSSLY